MTQITFQTPDESFEPTGRYRIEIAEHGETLADIELAAEAMPDLESPETLREIGQTFNHMAEMIGDVEHE